MCNLKVIFIPTPLDNPITGGEIYEAKLLEFLRKKFMNVESVKIDTFQLSIRVERSNYEMIFIWLRSIIRNFLYVFRIIKSKTNQRTIILEDAYYSTDLFLFNLLIRRIKKNVCIVPLVHHLYYPFRKQKFYQVLLKAVEALFLNASDWIIVNSEATEKHVKRLLKETKMFLIAYPGVDEEKIASRKRGNNSECRRLNILAVGLVTERKDFLTLLKAIKILINQYNESDFLVTIVGDLEKDRESSAKIIATVDALSLSNCVVFKGRVNDGELRDFYARSDIFVSTSLYEGFGMAIAEAMYNRLPVVATNSGAVRYLVKDGVHGFLVPPRDHKQLAEKIKLLLESEGLRKKMGTEGFCKAKKFDWNGTFNDVYRKMLKQCSSTTKYV